MDKKVFSSIFNDPEVGENARIEFGLFVSAKNGDPNVVNDQSKTNSITWWYLQGQDYMYLQPLAIKILSQVSFLI